MENNYSDKVGTIYGFFCVVKNTRDSGRAFCGTGVLLLMLLILRFKLNSSNYMYIYRGRGGREKRQTLYTTEINSVHCPVS